MNSRAKELLVLWHRWLPESATDTQIKEAAKRREAGDEPPTTSFHVNWPGEQNNNIFWQ